MMTALATVETGREMLRIEQETHSDHQGQE